MKWQSSTLYDDFLKAANNDVTVIQWDDPMPGSILAPANSGYSKRLPFKYDTKSGVVHLGQPNWYHHNIPSGPGTKANGYIWTHKNSVDWYDNLAGDYEKMAVERALSRHLGVPLERTKDEDYDFWHDI